ncbi:MAG TPA: iron-sulfur cluster assembly accessory protein [Chromatiales bacterium]|jgi:iron-sulfur cluster assembly protein|nr:iron-sulfur cluster assembly accessory protein [Chromatiales bacterium]
MAVTLTQSAAEHVARMLEGKKSMVGLRFGVKSSGCSGFAYIVDFASEIEDGDEVFEDHGVKVVVDKQSLTFVDGTEIDFTRDGINEGLRFNNPNMKNECGCGESFNI